MNILVLYIVQRDTRTSTVSAKAFNSLRNDSRISCNCLHLLRNLFSGYCYVYRIIAYTVFLEIRTRSPRITRSPCVSIRLVFRTHAVSCNGIINTPRERNNGYHCAHVISHGYHIYTWIYCIRSAPTGLATRVFPRHDVDDNTSLIIQWYSDNTVDNHVLTFVDLEPSRTFVCHSLHVH